LGLAQIIGATITIVFLVQTGVSGPTVVATVVTLCFIALSKLLFAGLDRKG
jgi:hypothetical protein